MQYAQNNGIVLISPSSTAVSLAVNKPYIYRFVPADNAQGPAMAAGIWSENITYIVPIYVINTYGEGLCASTENAFVALGGQYDHTNISYPDGTVEFSAQAALLNTEVTTAVSQYGASHVAVYAVTYEEIAGLMDAASQYPALSQVKWFGWLCTIVKTYRRSHCCNIRDKDPVPCHVLCSNTLRHTDFGYAIRTG
jgi:branched-chain amino acid transport system substrate-binding protein